MNNIYIYLGAYILLLIIISFIISRKQTKEDFLISGRNRPGWQILASKFAGAIGVGYFITYTGFAYEYGFGVFAMLIGIVLGYFTFAYWASPKIYEHSKKNKFYTMGDFVYHKTKSRFTLKLTNIVSSLILFSWLLIGIVGGGKIIADIGLLSYSWAVILTSLVVLSYIYLAGFKAVIITDVIQSIIIGILLIIVTFSIIGSESIPELLSVQTGNTDIITAIGFLLFGLLSLFSFINMYQLSYAAKSKRKLKHGLGMSVIPILIVAFFLLLIGLFMAKNVSGLDSGLVFTEALKNFLPSSILPLAIVLFFAGIMSSADTNVYGISSHYALSKRELKNPISTTRKSIFILMAIVTIIALIFSDIIDVSIVTGAISLTLSFPMIYLLLNKNNKGRFIGSVIGGLIGFIGALIYFGPEPILAIPILLGSLVGLLFKSKTKEKDLGVEFKF
ncbi:MAG: hypothetical protein KKF56_05560 [Nanoarchaeota archaeon]|nr:hypothetical protein [Nanoarchaeota archaeon]